MPGVLGPVPYPQHHVGSSGFYDLLRLEGIKSAIHGGPRPCDRTDGFLICWIRVFPRSEEDNRSLIGTHYARDTIAD